MQNSEPNLPENVERIPLVEEEARVEIEKKRTSTVRISTHTSTQQEWVAAELTRSDVQVTTVPVGRHVDEAPQVRTEGDTTIIPVFEEVIVVEKRLYLREEIHITRHSSVEAINEPVLLRKQEISVERIPDPEETSK